MKKINDFIYMSKSTKKAATLPIINHVRDRVVREDDDNRSDNGELLENERVIEDVTNTPHGGRGLSRFAGLFIMIYDHFVVINRNIYMANIVN